MKMTTGQERIIARIERAEARAAKAEARAERCERNKRERPIKILSLKNDPDCSCY